MFFGKWLDFLSIGLCLGPKLRDNNLSLLKLARKFAAEFNSMLGNEWFVPKSVTTALKWERYNCEIDSTSKAETSSSVRSGGSLKRSIEAAARQKDKKKRRPGRQVRSVDFEKLKLDVEKYFSPGKDVKIDQVRSLVTELRHFLVDFRTKHYEKRRHVTAKSDDDKSSKLKPVKKSVGKDFEELNISDDSTESGESKISTDSDEIRDHVNILHAVEGKLNSAAAEGFLEESEKRAIVDVYCQFSNVMLEDDFKMDSMMDILLEELGVRAHFTKSSVEELKDALEMKETAAGNISDQKERDVGDDT